jgi:hypothetical protein
VSMHYALLQERALGSMQAYHFITFAIPEIYSSDPFFSNLSCNLNHPCMQHYTLKSDTREWGPGFNASNNFIIPSHTPKLSQNLLKIYRQLTPMI